VSAVAAAVSVGVGLWVMAAPDVLDFGEPGRSVHHVLGPIVVSCGAIALWRVVRSVLRANGVLGVLLAGSPLLGGLPIEAVVAAVASGAVIAALALVPRRADDRFAGGWTGLVARRR
jgi:hypothetical protein